MEISTLSSACFKKTEISKQLSFNRMTIHQVEQRFKVSQSLKDCPQSGKSQVIRQEVIKKAFGIDPCQKLTTLEQKKKISISTVSRLFKKMSGRSLGRSRKLLLNAAIVQKRLEKTTHLLNDLTNPGNRINIFPVRKFAPLILSSTNYRFVEFGNVVSEHRRVSTTKHPA